MQVTKTQNTLISNLLGFKQRGLSIGFVPTMGALHEGHLSLVRSAKKQNDIVVVSIFVNPTQFNNQEDLINYPRNETKDIDMLQQEQCDIVFIPAVEEMYAKPDTRIFDFGTLDKIMEGEFRPGHFNGVAQIVTKLFDIVNPDKAYFGKKDFQQLAIIKYVVKALNYTVEIVAADTVRERDGLAMSSRNGRLSEEQRKYAPDIYKTLQAAVSMKNSHSIQSVEKWVTDTVNKIPTMKVQYFSIVDADTLQPILNWTDTNSIIGCIAVFCKTVRLIDNITF